MQNWLITGVYALDGLRGRCDTITPWLFEEHPAHTLHAMTSFILNIDVPSIQAAEQFYTAAFGLTVGRRFAADFVELSGWPVPLYLLQKKAGTIGAGQNARDYNRHWTPVHADVIVDDLDAALARATAAGAIVERPAVDVPYGRIAMVADPFGHGFCLIEFNSRGYDALL